VADAALADVILVHVVRTLCAQCSRPVHWWFDENVSCCLEALRCRRQCYGLVHPEVRQCTDNGAAPRSDRPQAPSLAQRSEHFYLVRRLLAGGTPSIPCCWHSFPDVALNSQNRLQTCSLYPPA
jgi:hypothetical protein